jgi:hypothetical protein
VLHHSKPSHVVDLSLELAQRLATQVEQQVEKEASGWVRKRSENKVIR